MTGQQAWMCGYSLCTWPDSVWDAHVYLCMCEARLADRMPEAEHWSQRTAGVSTHATNPLTLTSIMTVGLIPLERAALRGKRWEEVWQGRSYTVCCSSYSACNTKQYVSIPSLQMVFRKLEIIRRDGKENPSPGLFSVYQFLLLF